MSARQVSTFIKAPSNRVIPESAVPAFSPAKFRFPHSHFQIAIKPSVFHIHHFESAYFRISIFLLALCLLLPALLFAQVDTAWVRRYNGPGNGTDEARAIALDASGNVYVTGYSVSSGTYPNDYATIKYDSAGETLWVRRYDGPGGRNDEACGIAVDGAGNVYVTGFSYGANNDYATIKYNATGETLWVRRYNGPGDGADYAYAIAIDGVGNVYVTGECRGSGTGVDYATIKYDSLGNTLWVRTYNRSGSSTDKARTVAVDGAGNVYVTGASYGTNRDITTIKYNSSGDSLWVSIYNGPGDGDDYAEAIAVDGLGNVYVTGHSVGSGTERDYATIKYDSAGVQQWVATYNGPGNSYDYAYAMALDSAGNVYVTGRSTGSGTNYDYATIKYNSDGDSLWVKRYDASNTGDNAYAIAVDGLGNVYVTGKIRAGTARDYATIKYDSAGVQQWVATYDGPGNSADEAYAVVVDSLGNVYVTGMSYGSGTEFDYATIKYAQVPGIEENEIALSKSNTQMLRVFPNPFHKNAVIMVQGSGISKKQWVDLQVYDLSGGLVRTLFTENYPLTTAIIWDGRDEFGTEVPSGVYFLKLKAGDYSATEKLLLIR